MNVFEKHVVKLGCANLWSAAARSHDTAEQNKSNSHKKKTIRMRSMREIKPESCHFNWLRDSVTDGSVNYLSCDKTARVGVRFRENFIWIVSQINSLRNEISKLTILYNYINYFYFTVLHCFTTWHTAVLWSWFVDMFTFFRHFIWFKAIIKQSNNQIYLNKFMSSAIYF